MTLSICTATKAFSTKIVLAITDNGIGEVAGTHAQSGCFSGGCEKYRKVGYEVIP